MDNIRIDLGIKKVLINDGPEFIEFNPSDVAFAEQFYQLMKEFELKRVEYQARAAEIDAITELDPDGIPVNFPDKLAIMREVCEFMREKIDDLFGKGTSQKVFGDARTLNMFEQFITGITPYIRAERKKKIEKYVPSATSVKRRKHKVME